MRLLSYFNIEADRRNREAILRLLEPRPNAKILEVGPGAGLESVRAGKIVGTTYLYGLEMYGCGDVAKSNGLIIRECDLRNPWPCEDSEFDVVLSNQVLEHIPNTDHFFQETYRVLKWGGYAIISTPNLGSWVHIIMLIMTMQPVHCWVSDKFCGVGNPLSSLRGKLRDHPTHAHLRLFTVRALSEMAKNYGFRVERKDCGSYSVPIVQLDRLLCRINPFHGIYATIKARKIGNSNCL